jgi:hypothetical protein
MRISAAVLLMCCPSGRKTPSRWFPLLLSGGITDERYEMR